MTRTFTPPDLSGRLAAVTGASSGIGLWTAAGLAKAGADVILVCRDANRGADAQRFVAEKSGRMAPELVIADFADLKSVARAADAIAASQSALHILVNNAGLFVPVRELTRDGYEMTFAVNHLAPFLLTTRLLPSIERGGMDGSRKGRIVTVSSAAARGASIPFDDLMASNRYSMLPAYSTSKLANVLFTKELSRRLEGQRVTANCLHPGVVATRIGNKGAVMSAIWSVMKPFMIGPEQGAVNSLYVASSPEIENVSGEFFVKQRIAQINPLADDTTAAVRLWSESERLVNVATGL